MKLDMNFLILPFRDANELVKLHPKKLNVISVEKQDFVDPRMCKNHLHLKMDDIQDWHIERWNEELKRKGVIYPGKKEILEAIDFSKKNPVHIVHCHAGVSRSPAIGYAILRGNGFTKEQALNKVKEIAPISIPNERIIRLTDEIFG